MREIDIFNIDDEDVIIEENIDQDIETKIFKDEIENLGKHLNLSSEEINLISTLSRERKFSLSKTDILYPTQYVDKAKVFVQNFRFLSSVYNSLDNDNESLKNKIFQFLKTYNDLYFEILDLYIKMSVDINYGKSLVRNKLIKVLQENEEKINVFIDDLFSLGKVVSQYSPDDDVGIM